MTEYSKDDDPKYKRYEGPAKDTRPFPPGDRTKMVACTVCHHIGNKQRASVILYAGGFILCLLGGVILYHALGVPAIVFTDHFLFACMFLVPGIALFYLGSGRKRKCESCGNKSLVPLMSPAGRKIMNG